MAEIFFNSKTEFTGVEQCAILNDVQIEALRNTSPMKVFFNKEELLQKMEHELCKGIRFYPSIDEDNNYSAVAIGVRSNRTEIRTGGSAYFHSRKDAPSLRLNTNDSIKEDKRFLKFINQLEVYPFQRKVEAPTRLLFAAYFSKDAILKVLPDNAAGVYLYLDTLTTELKINDKVIENTTYDTFAMVGVDEDKQGVTDYYKSLAPCPPECSPDTDYKPDNGTQARGGW